MITSRYPRLPFAPSQTFGQNQLRGKFPRINTNSNLGIVNGGNMSADTQSPRRFNPLIGKEPPLKPTEDVSEPPRWIILDKAVLFFDAIFEQEGYPVPELHRAKINFYLRDRTIQVLEPIVIDGRITYKSLIIRHRIPYPTPSHEHFYDATDFNIGKEMMFYGMLFKIISCDNFSREFLEWCGVEVPEPIKLDCWTPPYCPQCSHIFTES